MAGPGGEGSSTTAAPDEGSSGSESTHASLAPVRTTTIHPEVSESEGATPAPDGPQVTIGLVSLVVDGRLAKLRLLYTPDFPRLDADETLSIYDMFADNGVAVSLVDPVNLLRYTVATDSEGRKLKPDDVFTKTQNHRTLATVYTFAAPKADTVDVYIAGRVAFEDVPVQRS